MYGRKYDLSGESGSTIAENKLMMQMGRASSRGIYRMRNRLSCWGRIVRSPG